MAKILILSVKCGGREAALAWKLQCEGHEVFLAPGNGYSDRWAVHVPIETRHHAMEHRYFWKIFRFCQANEIDLVVVGPEALLDIGVVDFLQEKGVCVFGPTQTAAQVECLKADGKNIMAAAGIPTAEYRMFSNHREAFHYVGTAQMPLMIKANGPAAVTRTLAAASVHEARAHLWRIFVEHLWGEEGNSVVIEQVVEGEELSWHAVCEGNSNHTADFPVAQDHSQLIPGGPYTGGVGVIVPVPWVTEEIRARMHRATRNILREMHRQGRPFRGLLYPGFKGSHMLECNVRFGDPETEAYLRLLKSPLGDLLFGSVDGTLGQMRKPEWHPGYAASVALVSGGYGRHSGKPEYGFPITGIEKAEQVPGVIVFPAGVRRSEDGQLLTDGNRVLHVTAVGETLEQAIDRAYAGVSCVHFANMDFSPNVGHSALMLQSAQERQRARNPL